jgi:hypothetical protein
MCNYSFVILSIGYALILYLAKNQQLRLHNIVIDADASPCGYIAWHNHYSGYSRIRVVRPVPKNERFGVQRMEMLAIYFALADKYKEYQKEKFQA